MRIASHNARDGISIARAMVSFGLAVAVVIYTLAIVAELGRIAPPADYRDALWVKLFALSILVLFIALPSALFFGGLLRLIEGVSSKPLGLVAWLIAGMIALAPVAGLFWYTDTAFEMLEFDPQPPYAWVNIRPPLVTLGYGLIGAFAAWLFRRAKLAA